MTLPGLCNIADNDRARKLIYFIRAPPYLYSKRKINIFVSPRKKTRAPLPLNFLPKVQTNATDIDTEIFN